MEKFTPSFTPEYFKSLLREVGAQQLYEEVERVIFDPEYMAKRVVLDEVHYNYNNYSGTRQPAPAIFQSTLCIIRIVLQIVV